MRRVALNYKRTSASRYSGNFSSLGYNQQNRHAAFREYGHGKTRERKEIGFADAVSTEQRRAKCREINNEQRKQADRKKKKGRKWAKEKSLTRVCGIFFPTEIVGASRNLKTRINAKSIGDANCDARRNNRNECNDVNLRRPFSIVTSIDDAAPRDKKDILLAQTRENDIAAKGKACRRERAPEKEDGAGEASMTDQWEG